VSLEKLGKYKVLGELGHGAMGVVYRARDPVINRLVALKTITTGVADYANLLQRFYREAQSAGGLQHPNIVTIYDMGDEGGIPYIAMELIEGETLEQIISRRVALPLTLKLTYALQACRAFDYAHKRGIVPRQRDGEHGRRREGCRLWNHSCDGGLQDRHGDACGNFCVHVAGAISRRTRR
jgi:eukaryotic-like serine/threonine-protein kinase